MALLDELPACTKCGLCKGRTQVVIGRGTPTAKLWFIGEAPGEQEDLQGKAFVGRAGKILDNHLKMRGLSEQDYFITNVVKCRPPHNRDPSEEEIRECTPYLVAQLQTFVPHTLVPMGNYATKFVLSEFRPDQMNEIPGIKTLHGKVRHISAGGLRVQVYPMYHPAATLHNPNLRETFAQDVLHMPLTLPPRQMQLEGFG